MVLMIARNNNRRLKEKADKAELTKLESDTEKDLINLKCEMSKEIDLKIEPVKEVNGEIFKQLIYIRERLDMHIDGENRKKVRYKKQG